MTSTTAAPAATATSLLEQLVVMQATQGGRREEIMLNGLIGNNGNGNGNNGNGNGNNGNNGNGNGNNGGTNNVGSFWGWLLGGLGLSGGVLALVMAVIFLIFGSGCLIAIFGGVEHFDNQAEIKESIEKGFSASETNQATIVENQKFTHGELEKAQRDRDNKASTAQGERRDYANDAAKDRQDKHEEMGKNVEEGNKHSKAAAYHARQANKPRSYTIKRTVRTQ